MIYWHKQSKEKPLTIPLKGTKETFKVDSRGVPKEGRYKFIAITTAQGISIVPLKRFWGAKSGDQCFNYETPMPMKILRLTPIEPNEEQAERIKYDPRWDEDDFFINSLLK